MNKAITAVVPSKGNRSRFRGKNIFLTKMLRRTVR